jgi:glutathione S-transferase
MILYLAPGACSLADHIALHEAGLNFDHVKVDLKTHRTEDGRAIPSSNRKAERLCPGVVAGQWRDID